MLIHPAVFKPQSFSLSTVNLAALWYAWGDFSQESWLAVSKEPPVSSPDYVHQIGKILWVQLNYPKGVKIQSKIEPP